MIVTGRLVAQRYQRVFTKRTRISIQIRGPQIITVASEQGEASTPNDGVQLTQASTSSPQQPYETWWQGELWYSSNVDGAQFIILILAED